MNKSEQQPPPSSLDWSRFGLGPDSISERPRDRSNEQYGIGGHQPAGPNELFAGEQNDEPWWKTQFFISEPILFGTLDGVFTSCLINVFGVIVFLRSGWMIGQAGLLNAISMILATVGIALITVLSAVGICERCRMESGGVYFLLAHVMGPRVGTAFGLLYVFGQAVGCSLFVLGLGESLAGFVGLDGNVAAQRGFASGAVLLLGIINVAGVKWVVKLQFVLLIILLLAALDLVVGSFVHTDVQNGFMGWWRGVISDNLYPDYFDGYNWFTVFGVFFPTITGILAGINMSGDLRNPSRDIPNGSLAAIFTVSGLYLMFALVLASTCTREALKTDFMISARVSALRVLLLAGLYVSSMSSCLGAMYGTPRVLQSIANENVIPFIRILGRGISSTPSPEQQQPPSHVVHKKTLSWYSNWCNRYLSLFGAFLKLGMMLMINWRYALTFIGTGFVIWVYVGLTNPAVKPGAASEFNFLLWLKSALLRFCGHRSVGYEEIVVPPTLSGVELSPSQLNEDNEDFSSRQRFHQTASVRPLYHDEHPDHTNIEVLR
ncbi:unnamed protein product [Nesidiocoris tenuis]|uniref:Amino acid permease/ SLC12A domain-containing protein n=1 Tax=Nesidiocoris tenuis TaxID=355587 RepID=A0A6H5GYW1_9HEMI|nr:unnamed protein product [Nesidiocoris tenuis]